MVIYTNEELRSIHDYRWKDNTWWVKGVPQGSPLSPLLSNILLNELDKELTKRNLRFVRYADDFSIYTKYKSYAYATLKAIEKWFLLWRTSENKT